MDSQGAQGWLLPRAILKSSATEHTIKMIFVTSWTFSNVHTYILIYIQKSLTMQNLQGGYRVWKRPVVLIIL